MASRHHRCRATWAAPWPTTPGSSDGGFGSWPDCSMPTPRRWAAEIGGLVVEHLDHLEEAVAERGIDIGVVAVPASGRPGGGGPAGLQWGSSRSSTSPRPSSRCPTGSRCAGWTSPPNSRCSATTSIWRSPSRHAERGRGGYPGLLRFVGFGYLSMPFIWASVPGVPVTRVRASGGRSANGVVSSVAQSIMNRFLALSSL